MNWLLIHFLIFQLLILSPYFILFIFILSQYSFLNSSLILVQRIYLHQYSYCYFKIMKIIMIFTIFTIYLYFLHIQVMYLQPKMEQEKKKIPFLFNLNSSSVFISLFISLFISPSHLHLHLLPSSNLLLSVKQL